MAVIYRQEILQDIAFFTSAPKAQFYDKLFLNIDLSDFPKSTAKTGRNRFSKRALLRTFIIMKCECFSRITDLVDYLNNNLIIAHYCGLCVHTASNQHNERKFEYYWGYKNHILVDCITGLPIYKLTTSADVSDSSVALDILSQTNNFLSVDEYTFLADKGYDIKAIYNTVKDLYRSDCVIPINKRNTKDLNKLASRHPICEAELAMHKDEKFSDNGRTRQKHCCPLKNSKSAFCLYNHKNWNNGKKHRSCTKYITLPNDYRLFIDRLCTPNRS